MFPELLKLYCSSLLILISGSISAQIYVTSGSLMNLVPFGSTANAVGVDHQKHEGYCIMKNGEVYAGSFRFHNSANPNNVKDNRLLDFDGPAGSIRLKFRNIRRLAVAGKDSLIRTNTDSTVFCYNRKAKMLLRMIVEDPLLRLYDDALVVDEVNQRSFMYYKTFEYTTGQGVGALFKPVEPMPSLADQKTTDFLRRGRNYFYSSGRKIRKLPGPGKFQKHFTFDPYIIEAAASLGKSFAAASAYMVMYTMNEDKHRLLHFFSPMEIIMADSSVLKGFGYIQPLDSERNYAYNLIHFIDDGALRIIAATDVKQVFWKQITYEVVYDKWEARYLFATRWDYEGKEYYVAEKVYNTNNFFNYYERNEFAVNLYKVLEDRQCKLIDSRKLYDAYKESLQRGPIQEN